MFIEKQKGEILGVVIVESGWGSILPTVIIANMMHGGPAEKSGKLNIGDQIMSINGTSLVGLPLSTCQSIIKVSCKENSIFPVSFPKLLYIQQYVTVKRGKFKYKDQVSSNTKIR